MASIKQAIELEDRFTSVINNIISSVNIVIATMAEAQGSVDAAFDPASVAAAKNAIDEATIAAQQMSDQLSHVKDPTDENTNHQRKHNRELREGMGYADNLFGKIKSMVGVYASFQTVQKAFDLSDQLTSTTARLELIVDDGGSVEELQNKIFASAERSRGSYQATADAVAKLGMQASQAFTSNDELIAFTELLNKQFVIAGASAQGVDSVMLQLTQSMAAGKLQGEELNAVLDNAQPIVANIQRYLEEVQGIDASNIKELASEGVITADIIKNAMFYTAEETNDKFAEMPQTFEQAWTSFKNNALMEFQPVLQKMNTLLNSEKFQTFADNAVNALTVVADIVLDIFDAVASVGNFISDNWENIEPIITGITIALAAICAGMAAYNAVQAISTLVQNAFNSALWACPITWIVAVVVAAVLAFVMFTEQIVGAIYWIGALGKNIGLACANFGIAIWNTIKNVGQWFVNLGGSIWAIIQNVGFGIANFFMGLVEVVKTIVGNIGAAFNNAWVFVQQTFWTLVDGIMQGLKSVAEFANETLGWLGVNIDTSSFDFAKKKAEELNEQYQEFGDVGAAWDKGMHTFEYKDVGASWEENPIDWSGDWNSGMNTFDVFQDGWGEAAYNAGAEAGAGIHDKIMGVFGGVSSLNTKDINSGALGGNFDDGLGSSLGGIEDNTEDIKDSLEISGEDLKYLRDIAEQETVNRFTTAEITIEQTNHNTVSGKMDLDGIVIGLTDAANEAVDMIAEGVHA